MKRLAQSASERVDPDGVPGSSARALRTEKPEIRLRKNAVATGTAMSAATRRAAQMLYLSTVACAEDGCTRCGLLATVIRPRKRSQPSLKARVA